MKAGNIYTGDYLLGVGFKQHVDILPQNLYELKDCDVAVFWGGEDIYTGLYGQKAMHTRAGFMSRRDFFEQAAFRFCVHNSIPMLGICRGSQFLCAMSGGELYQDVGHAHCSGDHLIKLKDGREIKVTSTHHQMMSPQRTQHELIGWCNNLSSSYLKEEKVSPPPVDYEIVYFPQTRALCIQGHPEYTPDGSIFKEVTKELIDEYLIGI